MPDGIYPAKDLEVSPYGLLSVADVWTPARVDSDPRWVRGFRTSFNADPQSVEILSNTNASVTGGSLSNRAAHFPELSDVTPFYVEVTESGSTLGLNLEETTRVLLNQIETVSQKAAEREVWTGVAAQADNLSDPYFVKAVPTVTIAKASLTSNVATVTTTAAHGFHAGETVTIAGLASTLAPLNGVHVITLAGPDYFTFDFVNADITEATTAVGTVSGPGPAAAQVVTSAAVSPDQALYLLEQAISSAPLGNSGVIHMTRDVASALDNKLQDDNGKLHTRLGTPVSVGSGYTGDGPEGATGAAASATNKWMYATGSVTVHLGDSDIVNTLAEGFNPQNNNYLLKALRPIAVYFDPSIFYTAQVTLPTA